MKDETFEKLKSFLDGLKIFFLLFLAFSILILGQQISTRILMEETKKEILQELKK